MPGSGPVRCLARLAHVLMGLPGLVLEARPDRLRLSRPVLVGYMAGVALIMIAGQLSRISGVPISGKGFLAQVLSFARGIGGIQLATAAVVAFGLRQRGVSVVGPLPTGLPVPGLPGLHVDDVRPQVVSGRSSVARGARFRYPGGRGRRCTMPSDGSGGG